MEKNGNKNVVFLDSVSTLGLEHSHEGLADLLKKQNVEVVIVGGIGQGAIDGLKFIKKVFSLIMRYIISIRSYSDAKELITKMEQKTSPFQGGCYFVPVPPFIFQQLMYYHTVLGAFTIVVDKGFSKGDSTVANELRVRRTEWIHTAVLWL